MLKSIRQLLVCFVLTALPLSGLIVFFELTQSTQSRFSGVLTSRNGLSVIPGVNAQLAEAGSADRAAKLSAAKFAGRVFATMSLGAFDVGMRGTFLSPDGRINQVTIVRRELLSDREIPIGDRAIMVDLASSALGGTFFDGAWRYTFEIEELGTKQLSVVQSSL